MTESYHFGRGSQNCHYFGSPVKQVLWTFAFETYPSRTKELDMVMGIVHLTLVQPAKELKQLTDPAALEILNTEVHHPPNESKHLNLRKATERICRVYVHDRKIQKS